MTNHYKKITAFTTCHNFRILNELNELLENEECMADIVNQALATHYEGSSRVSIIRDDGYATLLAVFKAFAKNGAKLNLDDNEKNAFRQFKQILEQMRSDLGYLPQSKNQKQQQQTEAIA